MDDSEWRGSNFCGKGDQVEVKLIFLTYFSESYNINKQLFITSISYYTE